MHTYCRVPLCINHQEKHQKGEVKGTSLYPFPLEYFVLQTELVSKLKMLWLRKQSLKEVEESQPVSVSLAELQQHLLQPSMMSKFGGEITQPSQCLEHQAFIGAALTLTGRCQEDITDAVALTPRLTWVIIQFHPRETRVVRHTATKHMSMWEKNSIPLDHWGKKNRKG